MMTSKGTPRKLSIMKISLKGRFITSNLVLDKETKLLEEASEYIQVRIKNAIQIFMKDTCRTVSKGRETKQVVLAAPIACIQVCWQPSAFHR
jgi:hypothetical protein